MGDIIDLDALDLFFGEATDAEARIYARLPADGPFDGWQLTGTLTGPECRFAKTLPATFSFRDLGAGQGLLAEAIVTEPCFWTPDLPFLYRCTVGVPPLGGSAPSQGGAPPKGGTPTVERLIGIRRLGAIGRSLYLDGKRWVARGVCRARADVSELTAAREASAALRVPAPNDAFCLEASRLGVPLFVDLDADAASLLPEIRRLAQWPSVFAIILDSSLPICAEHRAAARNTLFAVTWPRLSETRAASLGEPRPRAVPDWAQLAICSAVSTDYFAAAIRDCQLPVIAVRQISPNASIPQARAACDRLQFDLASFGDFAGYLV